MIDLYRNVINIRPTFLLLAVFSAALGVHGQVTQIDFSKRNEKFENKRFETSMESPQASPRWMSKSFSTNRFNTEQHRFADEEFSVAKMNLFQSKRFETEELDLEMREPETFRGNDKMFSPNELDKIKFNTLHHDVKKESRIADTEDAVNIEEVLDRLSLADLNRYQFRSSRSDEPGIPVRRAASAEAVE